MPSQRQFSRENVLSFTIVLVWCTGIRGLKRRSNTIVLVAEIRQKLQMMKKQNLMFIYDI
jgi:hypothetical protein